MCPMINILATEVPNVQTRWRLTGSGMGFLSGCRGWSSRRIVGFTRKPPGKLGLADAPLPSSRSLASSSSSAPAPRSRSAPETL